MLQRIQCSAERTLVALPDLLKYGLAVQVRLAGHASRPPPKDGSSAGPTSSYEQTASDSVETDADVRRSYIGNADANGGNDVLWCRRLALAFEPPGAWFRLRLSGSRGHGCRRGDRPERPDVAVGAGRCQVSSQVPSGIRTQVGGLGDAAERHVVDPRAAASTSNVRIASSSGAVIWTRSAACRASAFDRS